MWPQVSSDVFLAIASCRSRVLATEDEYRKLTLQNFRIRFTRHLPILIDFAAKSGV
jgi:hypothetical protein